MFFWVCRAVVMLEVEECSGFDRGQEDDGLFIGERKKAIITHQERNIRDYFNISVEQFKSFLNMINILS